MARKIPPYRKILLLTRKELESVHISRRIVKAPLLAILGRLQSFVSPELLPQPWIDIINAPDVLLLETDSLHIPKSILSRSTTQLAQTYRVVPLSLDGNVLTVATGGELDDRRLYDLRLMLQFECTGAVCTPKAIEALLNRYYPMTPGDVKKLQERLEEEGPATVPRPVPEESVTEFVDQLLIQAVDTGAQKLLFLEGTASLKILSVSQGNETLVDYLPKGFGHTVILELNGRLGIVPRDLGQNSVGQTSVKVAGKRVWLRWTANSAGEGERGWTLTIDDSPGGLERPAPHS